LSHYLQLYNHYNITMQNKIADLRRDYQLRSLDIGEVSPDPFVQFKGWFDEALKIANASKRFEANAMTLCTATPDGKPSARIVLLKGFDEKGFIFYTNYDSKKGQQITANPYVSLVFHWHEMERQVRIEGQAARLAPSLSDDYYDSRPRKSRLGAWASPQSQTIGDRAILEKNMDELQADYGEKKPIPRPSYWGGYCVEPSAIEFWQGRSSRLHDRIFYEKNNGKWRTRRLAP